MTKYAIWFWTINAICLLKPVPNENSKKQIVFQTYSSMRYLLYYTHEFDKQNTILMHKTYTYFSVRHFFERRYSDVIDSKIHCCQTTRIIIKNTLKFYENVQNPVKRILENRRNNYHDLNSRKRRTILKYFFIENPRYACSLKKR